MSKFSKLTLMLAATLFSAACDGDPELLSTIFLDLDETSMEALVGGEFNVDDAGIFDAQFAGMSAMVTVTSATTWDFEVDGEAIAELDISYGSCSYNGTVAPENNLLAEDFSGTFDPCRLGINASGRGTIQLNSNTLGTNVTFDVIEDPDNPGLCRVERNGTVIATDIPCGDATGTGVS